MQWKKLILIGDSNTQFGNGPSGWVGGISDPLQRKCDVVNRGMSGYNSTYFKTILPQVLEEFNPDFICGFIIMLGTNDSAANPIQQETLENFKANLGFIIDYCLSFSKLPKEKIIVISPGRIFEPKWQEYLKKQGGHDSGHRDGEVVKYAHAAIEVAKAKGVHSLDFNRIMRENIGENYGDFYSDGLHLSKFGGDLLVKHLSPLIQAHIGADLKQNFTDFMSLKKGQTKIDQ